MTTIGYCTGTTTLPYTFAIQAAHIPNLTNFTIVFNPPTPSTVSVQLSCQGSTKGFNTANNPVTFLSVYPNGEQFTSIPATDSKVLTGGTSYTVTVIRSS